MQSEKKDFIYKLKGIAIISVVCAHCGNRVSYTFLDDILNEVRGNIATIGVPLFFAISGYLFHNKKTWSVFWKAKWYTTIIPWIFWGLVVWGYEVVRKGLSYAKISDWLLGIGNYLWYLRTLILFWIVLYFIKKYNQKRLIFIMAVVIRVILYDIVRVQIQNVIIGDFILNLPFFTFGMVLDEAKRVSTKTIENEYGWCSIILILIPLLLNNHKMSYASPFFLMYVCGCALITIILLEKNQYNCITIDWLIALGKESYLIYLIHMPVAGIISNLFSRNNILLYFVWLQPIIVLIISTYMVKVIKYFCNKYDLFLFVVGSSRYK